MEKKKTIDATSGVHKEKEFRAATFAMMPDGTVKMRESKSLLLTPAELTELLGEK